MFLHKSTTKVSNTNPPQNCVLCPFSHDPSLQACFVPSTLRWSRRAGGFTAVLNRHGQLKERVGITGEGLFALWGPLTFNLPSKLTHWPLLLMPSAAQQHQRQCQTHPSHLSWARAFLAADSEKLIFISKQQHLVGLILICCSFSGTNDLKFMTQAAT